VKKTITVTLTLTEARAVHQYLRWAAQIEWQSAGAGCRGGPTRRVKLDRGQLFTHCVVEQCQWRPPAAAKTAVGRAAGKLRHILLGDPVVTPCPDDIGETHDYPNALVKPEDLEL
jgi:hypothetical protein